MSEFVFHTPESAPEAARPALADAQKSMGFVPNLFAGLANAPAALNAYVDISVNFNKTSLSAIERQLVLLTTSVVNGCEFCVAAHSMVAKQVARMPAAEVTAIREDRAPADAKLKALWELTRAIVEERGWVADHPAFAEFLEAGYTREQVLEVILGVTQKTLSNYANHLLETPLNPALEDERWERK